MTNRERLKLAIKNTMLDAHVMDFDTLVAEIASAVERVQQPEPPKKPE